MALTAHHHPARDHVTRHRVTDDHMAGDRTPATVAQTSPAATKRPTASGKAPAFRSLPRPTEQLSGWGRTKPVRCEVMRPCNPVAVRGILADRSTVIARGRGRSYGDAAQVAGGTVINTLALDGITNFDSASGTIQVESGVTIHDLLKAVVPRGWFIGVTPGTRQVSIGGAIAADVHGKNHHHDGTFCRHVRAMIVNTGRGIERLTPEQTPDEFWATAGGMGLTGVITSATLQLRPIETSLIVSTTERHNDLPALMEALRAADTSSTYTVAWIDTLNPGRRLGRGLVATGEHATRGDLDTRRARALDARPGFSRSVQLPDISLPLLNPTLGKVFNSAWYRINRPGERLESIGHFFHPLDAIANWNLLYGKHGFIQWQIAVPDSATWIVAEALERLSAIGAGSFMSILKRFGPSNDGYLSFPISGWTLAVDIPARIPRLAATLAELDQAVATVGGRVYLAKDARLDPCLVPAMYPELSEWRAIRDAMDPHDRFTSDLSRRLHLTGRPAVANGVTPAGAP